MPSQALDVVKQVGPYLGLACYGVALIFSMYGKIIKLLNIPPDQAPPILRVMLRHSFTIVMTLILTGTALVALSLLLKGAA